MKFRGFHSECIVETAGKVKRSVNVKRMFGEIQMVERISVGCTFFNY